MRKINLYWFKHKKGQGNFGDELNPYIIGKLSDSKINYIDIKYFSNDPYKCIKILIYALLHSEISIIRFFQYLKWNFVKNPKIILAIGSVLGMSQSNNFIIWGSGILYSNAKFADNNFKAVRGPETQKRISELGYKIPDVIGDPAILLPLVYTPNSAKNYKIGIIPHYIHYNVIKRICPDNILVINLVNDIETVIDQINSCDITISTSLHGIIVSHCYNIPSLWTKFLQNDKHLEGDNVKFKDYLSSVNIPMYEPLLIETIEDIKVDPLTNLIKLNYQPYLTPNREIIEIIQLNLLKVAPFKILNKFNKG